MPTSHVESATSDGEPGSRPTAAGAPRWRALVAPVALAGRTVAAFFSVVVSIAPLAWQRGPLGRRSAAGAQAAPESPEPPPGAGPDALTR